MSDKKKVVRVRDVMKTDVSVIDGLATVRDALDMMKANNTAVLIVEKRNESDEYGMILTSDIARHVMAKDRSPDRVNVYEIMTKPLISVDPDMDVRYCSRLFSQYNIVRAPVIENRQLIGTISPVSLVLEGLSNLY